MALLTPVSTDFTKTYEKDLSKEERQAKECAWEMERTSPFDEIIFSWNGIRPEKGKWIFWASLFVGEWSPWIRYAEWGPNLQKTFKDASQGSKVESYQDAIYLKDGLSDAFRVKVTAADGANLEQLDSIFACLSNLSSYSISPPQKPLESILLPNVPRRSQLKLDHPRLRDLCSPTATSTAINYLLGHQKVDPIRFSEKVRDGEFDIYGNWILNTAESYQELGKKFRCRVERLPSFASLHSYLTRGLPVVVSIRGPLAGAYIPMTFGHLICVIGYDAKAETVQCIDSAFPEDEQTSVSYPLSGFLEAWARRQNITYLFSPKTLESVLGKRIG